MNASPQTLSTRLSFPLPKAFYFLFFAAGASLMPFLAVYYQGLGFSGRQIGFLAAILPMMTLISAPLWGGAADAGQRHKAALMLSISGAIVIAWIFSLATTFAWIILIVLAFGFFVAPIMPLFDASVLELLGDRDDQYGRLRVWGTYGWGIAGPLLGWAMDFYGIEWAFYGYSILMFIGLLVAGLMPIKNPKTGEPYWRQFRLLLSNRQWLLFLGVIFIVGVCMAIIFNFLFLFMSDLGAGKTMMGLALTVATLSEIPAFLYANKAIQRFGVRGLLQLSLLFTVIRELALSLVQEPWMVLVVQVLHGVTFSTMWVAGVYYAGTRAPKGLGSTAQGLFSATFLGLGGMVGAILGGFLYDAYGPVAMFRFAALAALVGLILFSFTGRKRVKAGGVGTGAE